MNAVMMNVSISQRSIQSGCDKAGLFVVELNRKIYRKCL